MQGTQIFFPTCCWRNLPDNQVKETIMTDDENPLEGKEFEAALSKLEAGSEETKSIAMLIGELRDATVALQEQMAEGDGEEDEDDDK